MLFKRHVLLELLTRKLENFQLRSFDGNSEKLYCFCSSPYDENETWVGCDSNTCEWEWFHLSCVKIKSPKKELMLSSMQEREKESIEKEISNDCKIVINKDFTITFLISFSPF